jgi:D-serine deaminase-like pyridoxal phosphate-dependent protein
MSTRSDMIAVGTPIQDLDTPSVLIDLDRLEANIARAATFASDHRVSLRPHCKTHKVAEIARMQLAAGAVGLTVAKLGEAEAMADHGFGDIFIANQVVGAIKVRRAVALARRVRLSIGIDHIDQAVALGAAFRADRSVLPVHIEIDTGQRRAGVPAGAPAVDLAKAVGRIDGLRLDGIFTHQGHDYQVPSSDEITAVTLTAQDAMVATAGNIRAEFGIGCRVSIGSTPSLIDGALRDGVDELRVGAYVYLDASMANVVGHYDWCALTVLSTVVNRPTSSRVVLDAGGRALSRDRRGAGTVLETPGYGHVVEYPELMIDRLSDEHAVIDNADSDIAIGEKVRIIPNHAGGVSNLFDHVFAVRSGAVEDVWRVTARGRNQ